MEWIIHYGIEGKTMLVNKPFDVVSFTQLEENRRNKSGYGTIPNADRRYVWGDDHVTKRKAMDFVAKIINNIESQGYTLSEVTRGQIAGDTSREAIKRRNAAAVVATSNTPNSRFDRIFSTNDLRTNETFLQALHRMRRNAVGTTGNSNNNNNAGGWARGII